MVNAFRLSLTLVLAAGLTAPALSQAPAQTPAQPAVNGPDPNEIICEKQEVTGSRLATKKICLTRAQWADRRLQDRQQLEHVQVERGAKGE
jgi:invasion protein IalB